MPLVLRHHVSHRKNKKTSFNSHDRKLINSLVIPAAIFEPLMILPQIFKIYHLHNATSLSIFTWVAFEVFDLMWLLYGVLHRNKPILITKGLWIALQAIVIIGIIRYG